MYNQRKYKRRIRYSVEKVFTTRGAKALHKQCVRTTESFQSRNSLLYRTELPVDVISKAVTIFCLKQQPI